ncbi:hypothetical protein [Streptomyces sp. cg35]|uniref:hypothetical protein n=1 Tax=Streptomyces sp. cg35 TaxID=3421650 RepID=UPI003D16ADED
MEDFTPVSQPLPSDLVDADLSGALAFLGDGPRRIAQMLQIRAIALYGVQTTIGIGPSGTQPVRTLLQLPNEKLACGRRHYGGKPSQFAGSRDTLPALGECE